MSIFFCPKISIEDNFWWIQVWFHFYLVLKNIFCFRNPWGILQYKIGKWNKFKFDIAFFRGVNESKKSYFAIDDIQVTVLYMRSENLNLIAFSIKLINCLESPSSLPQQCNDQKELKCNRFEMNCFDKKNLVMKY